jgi:hypothetical protein
MTRFYRAMLQDGLSPAAALRAAQIAMWRDPRWSSPTYWAGFNPRVHAFLVQGDLAGRSGAA